MGKHIKFHQMSNNFYALETAVLAVSLECYTNIQAKNTFITKVFVTVEIQIWPILWGCQVQVIFITSHSHLAVSKL